LGEYRSAMQSMTGGRAVMVFANGPCADWDTMGDPWSSISDGDQRMRALNTSYNTLLADGSKLADLATELCPNGKYTSTIEGVNNARPDGYHLSEEGARAVVSRWLGPLLLSAGGRATS